jgi:MFS family permease
MGWDKKVLLVYMTATTFLMFSGRLLVPTLTGNLEDSFGISHAEIGLGMTLFWLFYGLMQFPSGVISDEKGGKPVANFAIFTFASAFFLMSVAYNYTIFLLSLILLGIGFGCFYTVSIKMISNRFTKKRGKILGIQSAMASLAGITPIFVLPFVDEFGWRILILLWAIISLLIGILFYRRVHERKKEIQPKREGVQNGVQIFKDTNVVMLLGMNTIMSFCWFGIISFLPIYLIEGKGINEATAGIIFSLLFATGFFLKPFIGHLSDHYSKKILMITLLFIAALSCFLLTQAKTVYMSALGVIMAASVSALFPLRSAYLLNKWPSRSRGSRTGMFATIVIMLSSLSPVIVGYGAEQIGFNTIFLIFSFIIFITATIVASVKFIYPSIKNKRNTAIND